MSQLREIALSTVRHLAGAASGAVVGFLGSQSFLVFEEGGLSEVSEGVEALVLGLSLGVYALVEKALKPLFRRFFGSSGE